MIGESFESVLAAARTGAEWAITALYREFNGPLVRFFAAQARGSADDLAQDTWVAAGRTLANFGGDERAFRAWLFTIARRVLIAHWRAEGRRRAVPVDPAMLVDAPDTVDPQGGVDAAHAAAELVAGLPDEQAQVVLLRVVGGLDVEEVAAIMGKRPGAIRVIQHRALRRLAQRLGGRKNL